MGRLDRSVEAVAAAILELFGNGNVEIAGFLTRAGWNS